VLAIEKSQGELERQAVPYDRTLDRVATAVAIFNAQQQLVFFNEAYRKLWQLDPSRLPGPLRRVGEKELHLWVGGWMKDRARKLARRAPVTTRHLLFALSSRISEAKRNSGGVGRSAASTSNAAFASLASNEVTHCVTCSGT